MNASQSDASFISVHRQESEEKTVQSKLRAYERKMVKHQEAKAKALRACSQKGGRLFLGVMEKR